MTAVDEARIKACDEAYDKLKAHAKAPEPKWKKEKAAAPVEKEEILKIKLQIDADKVRLSQILALKELFRSHPGKSTLELHFHSNQKRLGTVFVDSQWGVKADKTFQEKLKEESAKIGFTWSS